MTMQASNYFCGCFLHVEPNYNSEKKSSRKHPQKISYALTLVLCIHVHIANNYRKLLIIFINLWNSFRKIFSMRIWSQSQLIFSILEKINFAMCFLIDHQRWQLCEHPELAVPIANCSSHLFFKWSNRQNNGYVLFLVKHIHF